MTLDCNAALFRLTGVNLDNLDGVTEDQLILAYDQAKNLSKADHPFGPTLRRKGMERFGEALGITPEASASPALA